MPSAGLEQRARPTGEILPLYGLIPSPCGWTATQHPQGNRARTRLMQLTPALPVPQGAALTLHLHSGGAELPIFSHSAKHHFAAILKKQSLEFPFHSHPHFPRAVKAPSAFPPQAPHSCLQLSSTALPRPPLHIHFGSRLGSHPPLLHCLPSTPHSPSSAPSHLPRHLYPPSRGPLTAKPLPPTSFYRGRRSSPQIAGELPSWLLGEEWAGSRCWLHSPHQL